MSAVIAAVDILQGRLWEFVVNTSAQAEVVGFTEIEMELIQFDDVPDDSSYQSASKSVKVQETHGYDCTIAVEIDEVVTADLLSIRTTGDEVVLTSTTGGANGTGKTLTMAACDKIDAYVKGGKTYIIATKRVAAGAVAYAITDNV